MWAMVALQALSVLFGAVVLAGPQQKAPEPPAPDPATYPCDEDGAIRCSFQQVDTVTGSRSLDDMRIISKYIQLVSERNRRYYIAWQTKAPSATYELVKRVKSFPYLPYGDTHAIVGLEIVLNQANDQLVVRYPKKPSQKPSKQPRPNGTARVADGGLASYGTTLSDFIKTLQKEIEKLKKYEK